jgi:hypothetical protein
MILTFIANATYYLINLSKSLGFKKAAKSVANVQEKLLLNIVRANAQTKYGRDFNFSSISSIEDFQNCVPLISYQDLLPFVEKLKQGEKNVLTGECIDRFVFSSGTVSATKLIPYNKTLRKQFGKSLAPWLNNIFWNYPSVLSGPSFWIVTPPGTMPEVEGKIPAGFDDDSSYFGRIERFFIRKIMAVPDEVSQLANLQNYYYALSYFLLKENNLRLISVWNPTILSIILNFIATNKNLLLKDILDGTLTLPSGEDELKRKLLQRSLHPKKRRAKELTSILKNNKPYNWTKVWPKLTLISCWTHAWAKELIPGIKKLFPGVVIQGKGLLATEAFISFPFETTTNSVEEEQPVLAINSHFFEFIDNETGEITLAHKIEEGRKYEVIVTTGGGLYRYKLNDVVEVKGFYRSVPRIEFMGKTDIVSDVCGEKLHESHVSEVLQKTMELFEIKSSFHFIAPSVEGSLAGYVLYLNEEGIDKFTIDFSKLTKAIDDALKENFHYRKCRELGQLNTPGIFLLKQEAIETYLSIKAKNSKISTQKLVKLEKETDWDKKLDGYYIESTLASQ